MMLADMHPEDVKAALRKRYRSIAAFEVEKALPTKSVHDVLRGRPNARVKGAIEAALASPIENPSKSDFSDSSLAEMAHRINAEGR